MSYDTTGQISREGNMVGKRQSDDKVSLETDPNFQEVYTHTSTHTHTDTRGERSAVMFSTNTVTRWRL